MPKRRICRRISKEAYKKFHKYCFFCGEDDYAALQCHRILPGENGGTYHEVNTLTVCASCHCKIHAGRLKIDRKYTQGSTPTYMVHYWFDGEEFWRNEEAGVSVTQCSGDYHSGLGKSRSINRSTPDNNRVGRSEQSGVGEVFHDSSRIKENEEK